MPRPKKNQATFTNNDGTATTPEFKIKTKEQLQLEALQMSVANLQLRVAALEAHQNPNPFASMDAMLASARAASPIPMPGLPVFGQPHPMYARMGATPVPNQMYQPGPQSMYLEPKLKNPDTVNKIMSTDLRIFGFTEAQIDQLHKHGIFVLGKLIAAITRAEETTLSLKMYDNADLLRKAHILLEWIKQFIADDASIINPAIDNANNLLMRISKEGEKDHGDHV